MSKHSKGGQTTVSRYGISHMREIGAIGGQTTAEKYGSAYMASIAKKGAARLWEKYRLVPVGITEFLLVDRETGEVKGKR